MRLIAAVALGGAIGAVLRFWLSNTVYHLMGRGFPYGTLAANVLGSLAMGILYVVVFERIEVAAPWRAFLLTGVLGAFTTFSTFSIETLALAEGGMHLRAALNVVASVVVCLGACWVGMLAARSF